tara:strand:+ start:597 stop:740 length:144 start_codon:yes stop_codon:yes gene_type:complete
VFKGDVGDGGWGSVGLGGGVGVTVSITGSHSISGFTGEWVSVIDSNS